MITQSNVKVPFKIWRKARIVRGIGMILIFITGYFAMFIYMSDRIYNQLIWGILLFLGFQLIFPISDRIEKSTPFKEPFKDKVQEEEK